MWHEIILAALCLLFYVLLKIRDTKPNKVKYFAKLVYVYLFMVVWAFGNLSVTLFKKRDVSNRLIGLKWLQKTSSMFGMKWQIQNQEYLEKPGGAVIISNHQSTMDTVGLLLAWDKVDKVIAVVKRELWVLGALALASYKGGTEFIDRSSPKKAYEALERLSRVLHDGTKIWIFPEGTRNTDGKKKLLPFKKGAFAIAVAAQVPIIPVVYSPLYFINEKECIFYNDGKAIMRCLEPVPTEGLTPEDIPELQERLHKIVLDAFEKLSKEILNDLPMDTLLAKEILF